ncbi:hypothetical protein ACRAWD_25825 [Caulobacter segnis]
MRRISMIQIWLAPGRRRSCEAALAVASDIAETLSDVALAVRGTSPRPCAP